MYITTMCAAYGAPLMYNEFGKSVEGFCAKLTIDVDTIAHILFI